MKKSTFVPKGNQNPVPKNGEQQLTPDAQDRDAAPDTSFRDKPAAYELWGPPSGLRNA